MPADGPGLRGLSPGAEARLPPPFRYPGLNPWTGPFILRPWFDRMALPLLMRVFFPLSRAWAAAGGCHGALERFLREAYGPEGKPPAPGRQAARFVATVAARQRAYEAAERHWQALYFGRDGSAAAPDAAVLVEAQSVRREAAQRFMAARAAALPLHLARRVPPLRFASRGGRSARNGGPARRNHRGRAGRGHRLPDPARRSG